MLSCQPHSLPPMTKYIMTCGQQRATRMPALVRLRMHARTCTHPQTVLEGERALHYLPGTQAYPHAQGALHVTEQSEIFKHRIQRKKPPRQIAALQHEMRCRRLTVPEQKFSPDKAFWLEIGRVQSSACSGQFFKLARD